MKALLHIQLSAASLLLVLIFSLNGYGITDEGFALNVLEAKSNFAGLFTHYFLFYSPIFHWLGRNITFIRVFNILIIYFSSYLLFFVALRAAPINSFISQSSANAVWSRSSILRKYIPALSSLSLLSLWPFTTPSYSHSAFLGAILISFLILSPSLRDSDRSTRLVSLTAGSLGTYLLLLSKLPTAAIFISSIILFAIFARIGNRRSTFLPIAFGIALWLIHLSVVMPGGFFSALNDILLSSHILSSYDANAYSVVDLFKRLIPGKLNLIALYFSCLFVFCLSRKSSKGFIYYLSCHPLSLYCFALFLISPLLLYFTASQSGNFLHLVDFSRPWAYSFLSSVIAFTFFFLLFAVLKSAIPFDFSCKRFWPNFFEMPSNVPCNISSKSFYCQSIYFLSAPFALAFFTTNAFYEYLSQSVIFWALLILWVWISRGDPHKNFYRFLTIATISPLCVFAFALNTYLLFPYTQKSFYGASLSVSSDDDQFLIFNSDQLSRLQVLRSALLREGFRPNNLLLDLTGGFLPGFQYFIAAKPVGWPWILGYAPGSTNVASSILENVDYAEIMNAWIVVKNDEVNPNLDSKIVLDRLGLDLFKGNTHQLALISPCLHQGSGKDCRMYFFKPEKNSRV